MDDAGRPGPHDGAVNRIVSLDVVRGAAVCGILFVNVPPLLGMSGYSDAGSGPNPVRHVLDLFVQQRFFPIFSLLFGIGFGIMWGSARARAAHPRLVMLRRLLVLLGLGFLHAQLHPGEALLPYAVAALVLLLPLTFVPDRWIPGTAGVLGAVLLAVGTFEGGGLLIVPGLLVLGFAIGRTDLPRRVERAPRAVVVATLTLAGASAIALWWQENALIGPDELSARGVPGAFAGVVLAACYIGLLLWAVQSPLRDAVVAVFAPLGRTALTTYVSATLVIVAIALFLPSGWGEAAGTRDWLLVMGACVLLLVTQWAFARWCLSRYGQGPFERLWRIATWRGARPAVTARPGEEPAPSPAA